MRVTASKVILGGTSEAIGQKWAVRKAAKLRKGCGVISRGQILRQERVLSQARLGISDQPAHRL